ncbi:Nucleoid-associated protein [Rosistilla oblonga]|uniref:Nucleoid-associated protein Mal33_22930 n=1 Tax=Rosistilla oblonga TaxID=2527990 RepID=A0A518ITA4_9BACT|nr:YbaB/EbfC family nucleoid-associated protein [Rosistilla oblonga]QDV12273.1 Nucleoid-associated protein [Rosistilla oblonga]QDV56311.1 Nucleoid-associated protein [Rosistilla oblonga]
MFKGLSDIASLMQQAQKLPAKMEELNRQLQAERVTGSAGGGMVTVEMNGTGEVTAVRIEQELIDQGDREMIEDLLPAAINEANGKAKAKQAESMQGLTGGINLPGMEAALSKFTGGGGGAS